MNPSRDGHKHPRARVVRIGNRTVLTRGLERRFFSDLYHYCMTASWWQFFISAAAIFVVLNLGFAFLYWLGDNPIANARPGHFADLFYFSTETLGTVGYGDMHPQTDYAHLVASIEMFTGIGSVAVLAGLIFTRFSRPRARILFAKHPVISIYNEQATLMIRVANARHDLINDAAVRLWVLQLGTIATGDRFRRFHELRLERSENPIFALSWTILHVIDETSPLYGLDTDTMKETDSNLILTFSGLDQTSGQHLHARTAYSYDDLRWRHRYVDILDVDEDGMPRIDYSRFHETLEQED
jgi:inward rectifier potassium channel